MMVSAMSGPNSKGDLHLNVEGDGRDSVQGGPQQKLAQAAASVKNPLYCSDVCLPLQLMFMFQDTRTHVVVELYDTERSYVESLQTIVTVSPFKCAFRGG